MTRATALGWAILMIAAGTLGCGSKGDGGGGAQSFSCESDDSATAKACSCASLAAASRAVATCSKTSIASPANATPACCETHLKVGAVDQLVQCACYAVVCRATATACTCDKDVTDRPGETIVADCSAFGAANPTAHCCSDGARCLCGSATCSTGQTAVPSCNADAICADPDLHKVAATCKGP